MAMTVVRLTRSAALLLTAAVLCTAPALSDQRPSTVRGEAYDAVFNLDYDRADALFRKAIEANPRNPRASARSLSCVRLATS